MQTKNFFNHQSPIITGSFKYTYLYFHTSILPYFRTSVHIYFHTSILLHLRTSRIPYLHTSILPYLYTSILLYLYTSINTLSYNNIKDRNKKVKQEKSKLPPVFNSKTINHINPNIAHKIKNILSYGLILGSNVKLQTYITYQIKHTYKFFTNLPTVKNLFVLLNSRRSKLTKTSPDTYYKKYFFIKNKIQITSKIKLASKIQQKTYILNIQNHKNIIYGYFLDNSQLYENQQVDI